MILRRATPPPQFFPARGQKGRRGRFSPAAAGGSTGLIASPRSAKFDPGDPGAMLKRAPSPCADEGAAGGSTFCFRRTSMIGYDESEQLDKELARYFVRLTSRKASVPSGSQLGVPGRDRARSRQTQITLSLIMREPVHGSSFMRRSKLTNLGSARKGSNRGSTFRKIAQ